MVQPLNLSGEDGASRPALVHYQPNEALDPAFTLVTSLGLDEEIVMMNHCAAQRHGVASGRGVFSSTPWSGGLHYLSMSPERHEVITDIP